MRKYLLTVAALFILLFSAMAQNRTITGRVTDNSGNAVIRASVLVKGTQIGVSTNASGDFTIEAPASATTLVVSSVDQTTKQVAITSGRMSVSMMPKTGSLEEVVVVGYGTQKKALVTGSISSVKAADIENKPFTSIDKGLQGLVPGLQSVSSSGAPGSTTDIRIRGISSINAGNDPLYVIDGAIINSGQASQQATSSNLLSTLNPNDIESINVLKDAASTSIYGSRGANGVILITTKKGKAGKTKFRFDTEVGYNRTAYENNRYRPLNAKEYIDITREGLTNAGVSQANIDVNLTSLGNGNGTDFNWLDAVTRQGKQQQFNLSASGGSDKTTFFMSGGYFKQDGTVVGSDLKRYNADIRVTNQATDKLTINMNLDGGFVNQNAPLNGGNFGNPVLSSYFILPTRSAYKTGSDSLNYLTADFPTSSIYNTVAINSLDKRNLRQFSARGSVSGEYKILNNLVFKSNIGGDYDNLEENQYNNPFYGDGSSLLPGSPTFGPNILYNPVSTGRAFASLTRYFNYTWTNTLALHQNILKNGDAYFNLKIGYENQKSQGYLTRLQNTGFPLTLALQYPSSAATPKTANGTISDYTFVSQFSTADFSYKDKYVVSGSFRRDGSSRFSPNHKYGNFWSVGATWNADKEVFIEKLAWISQLKFRASYGKVGNAAIGNYDYFPGYGFGANYNSTPGSFPNNVGNSELTWENNKPFDIGMDISVLKNRATFTIDYYNRKSTDLLLDRPLSPTSGFLSVRKNIGALENKGIELSLNVIPVQTKDFTWTINANYAHNTNKVTSLPDGNDVPSPVSGIFLIRQGYDVQSFYSRVYDKADPVNGDPLWFLDSSKGSTTNVYANAQRVIYGSASPKYFGSVTNSFNFKGFSLQAQFYYSAGNYVQTGFESFFVGAGANPTFNKVARVLDRWQKPGDLTDIPKYIYGGNKSFQSFSSFYLNNGDYIRLRNLQLGYTVPQSLIKKRDISNLFFYVRGTNLFTWVKDPNLPFDPEQGINSQSNLNVFVPRTITFGLNLGF